MIRQWHGTAYRSARLRQLRLEASEPFYRHHGLQRALRCLRAHSRSHGRLRQMLDHAIRHRQHSVMARWLHVWRRETGFRPRDATIASQIADSHRTRTLHSTLINWWKACAAARRSRETERMAAEFRIAFLQRRCMIAWARVLKRKAAVASASRELALRLPTIATRYSFDAWKRHFASRRHQATIAQVQVDVSSRMCNTLLAVSCIPLLVHNHC